MTPSFAEILHISPYPSPADSLGGDLSLLFRPLFCEVKVIAEPLASQDLVDAEARVTVGKRQEVVPAESCQSQNHSTSDPCAHHAVTRESLASRDMLLGLLASLTGGGQFFCGVGVENELEQCSCDEG